MGNHCLPANLYNWLYLRIAFISETLSRACHWHNDFHRVFPLSSVQLRSFHFNLNSSSFSHREVSQLVKPDYSWRLRPALTKWNTIMDFSSLTYSFTHFL